MVHFQEALPKSPFLPGPCSKMWLDYSNNQNLKVGISASPFTSYMTSKFPPMPTRCSRDE